jgi:predicted RNA-binding Zn-ribbon protein involved in translation (DUF1610 family)
MIQFKILIHAGCKTIQYPCPDCGRINIRSFGMHITKELYEKECWFCHKNQLPMLNLVHHQEDRINHYFSNKPPIISGIY